MGKANLTDCPCCGREITQDEHVSVCSICGCVMHERCWQENGRCTTLGCTGRPTAVVRASMALGSVGAVEIPDTQDVAGTTLGKTCPFCQTPMKPGVDLVTCSECGMPHHAECWEANGGCTTFGCSGSSATASRPPVVPPAPAQAYLQPPTTRRKRPVVGPAIAAILLIGLMFGVLFAARVANRPSDTQYTSGSYTPPSDTSDESQSTDDETASEPVTQDGRPAESDTQPQPYFTVEGVPSSLATGESFEFVINAENVGTEAESGSITVSFSGDPEVAIVGTDSKQERVWGPGEKVGHYNSDLGQFDKQRIMASEPGAEAYFRSTPWGLHGQRYLRVRVRPDSIGTFEIKVRCTLTVSDQLVVDQGLPKHVTYPSQEAGDGEDQQGLPVKISQVEVDE